MKIYALILAGGGGTRFWPLSRQNSPKQLINLGGKDILINETINRLAGLIDKQDTYIVTNASQAKLLKPLLTEGMNYSNVFIEPSQKNTAPCILFSALSLSKKYGDGIVCILPSDHHIESVSEFRATLEDGIRLAQEDDCLVTIGIRPTFASTGYGYIKFDRERAAINAYKVDEFVEKPNFEKASQFIELGNFLWNSGILIGKISTIIDDFKRFLPRIYEKLVKAFEEDDPEEIRNKLVYQYNEVQNISIDYGILERSDHVYVIPGEFGWNDVGSWDALGSIYKPDKEGNVVKADHIGLGTKNSIIYGNEKLIATVGLEDMIVVATEDALLICPRSRAQDVKKIVDKLKDDNRINLL